MDGSTAPPKGAPPANARGRKSPADGPARPSLGKILRGIRERNNWRISDVSKMTGLAVSTISKVENDQMSLTYDKLQQLASGLSLDLVELFTERPKEPAPKTVTGRRSIGRAGEGVHITAGFYEYLYLNADLAWKGMVPIIGEARARSLEEFGELIRHDGEEFVFVLEGEVEVHTEYYSPVTLRRGDYLYFDSGMGHAYISKSAPVARFLVVCSGCVSEDIFDSVREQFGRSAASRSEKAGAPPAPSPGNHRVRAPRKQS